jgi:N-acetylglucosamine-6-phosphate deacetylase
MNPPAVIEGVSLPDLSPMAVEIGGGLIKNIRRINKLSPGSENLFIAPGMIDIQINGYMSVSFSLEGGNGSGADNNELSVEDCRKVTECLWKEGITSYFPTLTTNSRDLLLKNFRILRKAMDEPSLLGSIAGFHLEGPYISPVDGYRGAHPKEHVRIPDWKEFLELHKASGEKIILVTLAPEVEGALEFITKCRERGIVVSLGHHNGSREVIKAAIDMGARLSTHLGNGCANLINRHHNPIWPQLADDRLMISIISDGFHLPDEVLQVFFRVKGADHIIITSDITNFAGLPPGEYKTRKGETIVKTEEGNLMFSIGVLYGSAVPLPQALGHMMKVTGCGLASAIQMVTGNPARLHNLNDRGALEPGKRADIILFSVSDSKLKIKKTFVSGELVYQAE